MSSWFEPEEPINNFVETVYLGRLCFPRADVILTYNSASGSMLDFCLILNFPFGPSFQMYLGFIWMLLGFAVQNGRISEKTAQHGISTTLTIVSNGGHWFNVTRRRGGGKTINHVHNVLMLFGEVCLTFLRIVKISPMFTIIVTYSSS